MQRVLDFTAACDEDEANTHTDKHAQFTIACTTGSLICYTVSVMFELPSFSHEEYEGLVDVCLLNRFTFFLNRCDCVTLRW